MHVFFAAFEAEDCFDLVHAVIEALPRVLIRDDRAIGVENEFAKIPRDVFDLFGLFIIEALCGFAQSFEHGMRRFSIHVALLHQRELGAHLHSRKLNDFTVVRYFLIQELRARKSQDLHAVLVVLLVHVDQLNVTLMRESSLGGHVDNDR